MESFALGAAGGSAGMASAAFGALVAKFFSDQWDRGEMEQRLEEVRAQASQTSPPNVEPINVLRDLLEILEWSLQRCNNWWSSDELTRQLRHARHLGGVGMPSQRRATERLEVTTRQTGQQKLFDPQFGTVRGKSGVCAALAYLVAEFLELKHGKQSSDSARRSLRLAATSLANHQAFDKEETPELPLRAWDKVETLGLLDKRNFAKGQKLSWMTQAGPPQNFRNLAVALLCCLDVALSWTSLDFFGWMGKAEDTESGLLARSPRCRDLSTFQEFTGKLRQSLKMAWSSQRFWQQFEMHLDSMRRRPLEGPWASPWTLRESASMLVRNRTKVPLRVELHHPPKEPSPFSECLQPLLSNWVQPDPLLVAEVNPGIEWALRPKKEDGRDFQVKILTFSGVEVCARPLKRGDSYDFHVAVPAKPAQLRSLTLGSRSSDGMKDSDALSCSTASSARRLSLASTASSWSSANPNVREASEGRARGDIDGFTTCLCPQCLQCMPLQWERPTEEIYSEGVRCDHCKTEILADPADKGDKACGLDPASLRKQSFCHCSRCNFDLCRACAYKEMQMWWG